MRTPARHAVLPRTEEEGEENEDAPPTSYANHGHALNIISVVSWLFHFESISLAATSHPSAAPPTAHIYIVDTALRSQHAAPSHG